MNRRAVFLDRDGVLNQAIVRQGKPYPPPSLAELVIVPEAAAALSRLKAQGFRLLVVTNQPDVARGTQRREVVEAINARLKATLPLDQIYTCYHDTADRCECRKPLPGLLWQAAREWDIDPTQSYLIGDRGKDIEAGQRAGCTTLLLDMGYSEAIAVAPDYLVASLDDAVAVIIAKRSNQDDARR